MMALDTLLNPIRTDAPSGESLRYEPVYDQIAEARAEDDASLPTGLWAHAPKRADFGLVISLAQEALARRSKDLWLAVWLGHAEAKSKGLDTLPDALLLLQELQTRFWETLHPEREDGDYEARSAPLQWGLDQFANLLVELPSVAPAVSLLAYRMARLDLETTAAEDLDATLAATATQFFAERVKLLETIAQRLEQLFADCEARYGVDGPSFSKVRRAVEEVRNTVATLLRARRELEPETEVPDEAPGAREVEAEPPTAEKPDEADWQAGGGGADVEEAPGKESQASSSRETDERIARDDFQERPRSARVAELSVSAQPRNTFASRDEAIALMEAAGRYLARTAPTDPLGYAVLGARQWARVWETDEEASAAPSSELRTQLRSLRREERWEALLDAAMDGMVGERGALWLDLHREIWTAASHLNADSLAASAVAMTRLLVLAGAAPTNRFEDDTPIASEQTREWIATEVLGPDPDEEGESPAVQEDARALQAEARAVRDDEAEAPDPNASTGDAGSVGLFAEAGVLASGGNLPGAIGLLMEDAGRSAARRQGFFRRLEIAQLCVEADQHDVGRPVLEQLLREATEFGLERWEGARTLADVLFLLLRCTAELDDADEVWDERMAQLCTVDPVRAMQLQAEV